MISSVAEIALMIVSAIWPNWGGLSACRIDLCVCRGTALFLRRQSERSSCSDGCVCSGTALSLRCLLESMRPLRSSLSGRMARRATLRRASHRMLPSYLTWCWRLCCRPFVQMGQFRTGSDESRKVGLFQFDCDLFQFDCQCK